MSKSQYPLEQLQSSGFGTWKSTGVSELGVTQRDF